MVNFIKVAPLILLAFFLPESAIKLPLIFALFFVAFVVMSGVPDWLYVCPQCKKRKLVRSTSARVNRIVRMTFACKYCGFAVEGKIEFGDEYD